MYVKYINMILTFTITFLFFYFLISSKVFLTTFLVGNVLVASYFAFQYFLFTKECKDIQV
jgi:hypothetical protein